MWRLGDYIFIDTDNRLNILSGIQGALNLHFRAVIDCVRNDGLKKYFLDLLREEIDIYGDFLKYGKMKGWTKIPPIYINKK